MERCLRRLCGWVEGVEGGRGEGEDEGEGEGEGEGRKRGDGKMGRDWGVGSTDEMILQCPLTTYCIVRFGQR